MTDEDRKVQSGALREMLASEGGKILFKHIHDEVIAGWDAFIALPVDSKTSKAAYHAQANYKVLKDLREWVDSEIKLGE